MRFKFRYQFAIFVAASIVALVMIYLDCGSLSRVVCHEWVLGK